MKINWIYIKGFLLISVVFFLYGFANYRNSKLVLDRPNIKFEKGENLFMSYEMVNKLLIQKKQSPQNKAKSLIDLNSLEEVMLNHPMVEDANVYVTVDGHLKINLKQRTPIGRVNSGSSIYYIDRQGERMPLSTNYSARVPLVTGVIGVDDERDVYRLLSKIYNDDFLSKQIVGVQKNKSSNYSLITRIGAKEIELGKIIDLEKKIKNLKSFYLYAMKNNTIQNYKKISLKYNNQVVCTKKNS